MLWKYVFPYQHMDRSQRVNKMSFSGKKDFYSNLTMENITDADYKHEKRAWEGSRMQNH